jgi:hypothetical protein
MMKRRDFFGRLFGTAAAVRLSRLSVEPTENATTRVNPTDNEWFLADEPRVFSVRVRQAYTWRGIYGVTA